MKAMLMGLGALALVAMVGCSSSDSSSSTAVSADSACSDYASMFCDKVDQCASAFVTLAYGDAATCKSRLQLACLNAVHAPNTARTPESIESCVSAAKSLSCADLINGKTPTECQPVNGSLDDGKPCGTDDQCKSGFCGFDDSKKICGVCGPKPAAGSTCVDGKKCASGQTCSSSGKCAVPAAAGASCGADVPCGFGLSCVSGTCAKNLAEGAACDLTGGTTPACDVANGLVCLSGKCAKFAFAGPGGTCGYDYDVATKTASSAVICSKSGNCKTPMGMTKGTCVAVAADGAACGGTTGADCLPPAACIDGICKLPDASSCK